LPAVGLREIRGSRIHAPGWLIGALRSCPDDAGRVASRLVGVATRLYRIVSTVALAGVLLAASSNAAEILLPGEYHESNAATGVKGTWQALCARDGGVFLSDVVVERTVTPDDDRYVNVSVQGCDKPLLLVRGLNSALGEVETSFHGKVALAIGATQDLGLRATKARLVVNPVPDSPPVPNEDVLPPRTIELVREQKRQTLSKISQCYLCSPSLLWAGDLNRDGAVDLFLDLTEDDHGTRHELFVSGGGQANELVQSFAKLDNSCPY
jgi:hypothetical protein